MKNVLNYLLFVFMFALVATSVSAAASFTMNDLSFGSSEQARGQDVTATLTLTNTGNEALSIALTSTLSSNYNVRFSQNTVSLPNNGSTQDVIVTIFIPLSQSSGTIISSGAIKAVTSTLTKTSSVSITTVSELEVSKVMIEIDGDERSLKRGNTYDKDLKAGTPIKIRVYARNNFGSSEDIDINDVTVDIRSSGDLDLDESDDLSDLQYGDKDDVTFSANIPSDAEDGDNYNIEIKISGRDDNGAYHSDTFSTELEVKRESHEILINSYTISPQKVTCSGKVTIDTKLENTGRYDEDKVHLLISNLDLGLSQRFYELNIDKDDTLKKTYTFNIDNKTQPGQYDIMLTSFYDSDTESDTKVVSLIVESCTQTNTNTNNNANSGNNNQGNTNTNNQPIIPSVVPTTGATVAYGISSFTDSPLYIVVLISAIVVLLLILIILLVKFVF